MPSGALLVWQTVRTPRLGNMEADCLDLAARYPVDPDRVQEHIRAYAVLASGEFQAFCRDLHSECCDALVGSIASVDLRTVLRAQCRFGRKLDTGNPNPSNLGADFGRFGFDFWAAVLAADSAHSVRRHRLAEFNAWRNAIAHHGYDPVELGGTTILTIPKVQAWRTDCDAFALTFDAVMRTQLQATTGVAPWAP